VCVHNVRPDDDYEGDEELYNPITYERDRDEPAAWHRGDWPDESWPPRLPVRPRGRRWLVSGAILVAVAVAGTSFALLSGGTPARQAVAGSGGRSSARAGAKTVRPVPPALTPPISVSGARAVLASYTAANNTANARMSDALLATYETGTSYALDAGSYRQREAMRLGAYPAYGPLQSRFYIPREQAASYPHWFAVQVTNAIFTEPGTTRQPANVEYLVFTQSGPGARWLDAAEPYVPHGGTPAITLDSAGLATAVAPSATGLAVPAGQIATVTARSLDGHGPVPDPGGLTVSAEAAYWRPRLPKGTAIATTQAAAGTAVCGLRTQGGGALLFYADAASLTMTAPRGRALHIAVPGFYDSDQSLATASLRFLEQFAAYDPPAGTSAGRSGTRVVAEYSGITS
jgi:hypothetical protein